MGVQMEFSIMMGIFFSALSMITERSNSRMVLKNYPNCGELGSEDNKECIWDCQWKKIPNYVNIHGKLLITSNYVESTECIRDCPSIKKCLFPAPTIYDEFKLLGETNAT